MTACLAGRLALVTGAGNGAGAGIAKGLAAAGARVIVTDIDAAAANEISQSIVRDCGNAQALRLDVTDEQASRSLAGSLETLNGPLSILVNNAGVNLRGNLTAADGRDRWNRVLAVNVQGAFNVTMAFVEQLKQTRGSVVNIASTNSFIAPAGSGPYPVSKAAVAQLTRSLAVELAPAGVRVNALAPGIIDTAMANLVVSDPARLDAFLVRVPMKRVGQPSELAGPVVFLCSDAASYITGAILPVDGGFLAN